jgi:DNA-binding CsgD family transcriptional regulator
VDLLLDGLVSRLIGGGAAGSASLKQAVTAFRTEPDIRWLWMVMLTAMDLGDDDTWQVQVSRQGQAAREAGSVAVLPVALIHLAMLRTLSGNFRRRCRGHPGSGRHRLRDRRATWAARSPHPRCFPGPPRRDDGIDRQCPTQRDHQREGLIITAADYAEAIQQIGLGHYDMALEVALKASAENDALSASMSLPDVIEAAVRNNKPDVAVAALQRLSTVTQASGTQWALGVEALSQALLCEDRHEADRLYREAIERLGNTAIAVDLARAHLLYGEWLRRQRRRTDARVQLRTAHDMFSAMGAEAFADRVGRELRATGERLRNRSVETTFQLTPQQTQVARLASQGRSNPEIAAELFISPRTVEYHLRGVFTALGITSRNQLAGALDRSDASRIDSKAIAAQRRSLS